MAVDLDDLDLGIIGLLLRDGRTPAAQIAEQHGGTLKARNNPGQGLTMTLELPLENK